MRSLQSKKVRSACETVEVDADPSFSYRIRYEGVCGKDTMLLRQRETCADSSVPFYLALQTPEGEIRFCINRRKLTIF